jgi:hypothetical protein
MLGLPSSAESRFLNGSLGGPLPASSAATALRMGITSTPSSTSLAAAMLNKPMGLVEKIQVPATVIPEEQEDNWDDDFEEDISVTKIQALDKTVDKSSLGLSLNLDHTVTSDTVSGGKSSAPSISSVRSGSSSSSSGAETEKEEEREGDLTEREPERGLNLLDPNSHENEIADETDHSDNAQTIKASYSPGPKSVPLPLARPPSVATITESPSPSSRSNSGASSSRWPPTLDHHRERDDDDSFGDDFEDDDLEGIGEDADTLEGKALSFQQKQLTKGINGGMSLGRRGLFHPDDIKTFGLSAMGGSGGGLLTTRDNTPLPKTAPPQQQGMLFSASPPDFSSLSRALGPNGQMGDKTPRKRPGLSTVVPGASGPFSASAAGMGSSAFGGHSRSSSFSSGFSGMYGSTFNAGNGTRRLNGSTGSTRSTSSSSSSGSGGSGPGSASGSFGRADSRRMQSGSSSGVPSSGGSSTASSDERFGKYAEPDGEEDYDDVFGNLKFGPGVCKYLFLFLFGSLRPLFSMSFVRLGLIVCCSFSVR